MPTPEPKSGGSWGWSLEKDSGTLPILPLGNVSAPTAPNTQKPQTKTKPEQSITLFHPLFANEGLTGQLSIWPVMFEEPRYFPKGLDLWFCSVKQGRRLFITKDEINPSRPLSKLQMI